MTTPQNGILPEANTHGLFLSLDIRAGDQAMAQARKTLSQVPQLTEQLAKQYADDNLTSMVLISPGVWES